MIIRATTNSECYEGEIENLFLLSVSFGCDGHWFSACKLVDEQLEVNLRPIIRKEILVGNGKDICLCFRQASDFHEAYTVFECYAGMKMVEFQVDDTEFVLTC